MNVPNQPLIEYRRNATSDEWKTLPLPVGLGLGSDPWTWAREINSELGWQKYRKAA